MGHNLTLPALFGTPPHPRVVEADDEHYVVIFSSGDVPQVDSSAASGNNSLPRTVQQKRRGTVSHWSCIVQAAAPTRRCYVFETFHIGDTLLRQKPSPSGTSVWRFGFIEQGVRGQTGHCDHILKDQLWANSEYDDVIRSHDNHATEDEFRALGERWLNGWDGACVWRD